MKNTRQRGKRLYAVAQRHQTYKSASQFCLDARSRIVAANSTKASIRGLDRYLISHSGLIDDKTAKYENQSKVKSEIPYEQASLS